MKNLCVILTEKGREYIKERRKEIFGSQMKVLWATDIPQINISRWETGKDCPKYFAFRSYLNHLKIRKGFLTNREYVSGTKYVGFKIKKILGSKLSKEKAYILGVVGPGDGWITNNGYEIGLKVIDKDFADYFQCCLEKVFGLKCKRYIRKIIKPTKLVKSFGKPQYCVGLYSKSAVSSLKKYSVLFEEKVWRIPEKIKNSTNVYKAMYLRGIFDSQGSVAYSDKTRFIKLKMENKEGMDEILSLLNAIGIKANKHKKGKIIQISNQKYLNLYDKIIGFTIKRKREKLKKAINSYKQNHPCREDIKELLPKMIQLRKKNLSYRKIASIVGIGRGAVGRNLQGEYQ